MDIIFEIIFGWFITRFLGGNARYYLLKIGNPDISRKQIMGDGKDLSTQNDFYNVVVGLFLLILIVFVGGFLIQVLSASPNE